jgi:hypothetical protein
MEGRLVKGQIGVIAEGGPLASRAACSPEIYEIACDEAGTLSEIAIALPPKVTLWSEVALWPKIGRPIVGIKSWELEGRRGSG